MLHYRSREIALASISFPLIHITFLVDQQLTDVLNAQQLILVSNYNTVKDKAGRESAFSCGDDINASSARY